MSNSIQFQVPFRSAICRELSSARYIALRRAPRLQVVAAGFLFMASGSPAASPEAVVAQVEVGMEKLRAESTGKIVPVIVELEGKPGFLSTSSDAAGSENEPGDALRSTHAVVDHAHRLFQMQDAFVAALPGRGIQAIPRVKQMTRSDGSVVRIGYRFHYLMNGLVMWIDETDRARLAAQPEVVALHEPIQPRFFLDHSVNHALGSEPMVSARRAAVFGATEELSPLTTDSAHPEAPDWTGVDGLEGQGMYLSVVDSGLDYQHPMFGGTGLLTATPQQGGTEMNSTTDNQKVVYFYNLGGAVTLDDFGHGTHVASTAAGYLVDASTPNNGLGVGAPPGGVSMHGVAPQAKLLGYPVCNASSMCPGDVELGIEDSVSPVSLVGTSGASTPTMFAKPVADVINLSLGDTTGDPAGTSSRFSNNAALAGAVVVAAAGNDGPGAATVGAPCAGSLVVCVAAVQDPGSIAGGDLLEAGETAADTCAGQASCALQAPPFEQGAASEANQGAAEHQGLKLFAVAGGGAIPAGSVSAHYILVDRDESNVPLAVGNRVALLTGGTGTFFQIVNPVATNLPPPAAILLSSTVTSATAVTVVNGVPVFTIHPDDAQDLIDAMGVAGGAVHGSVSDQPIRIKSSVDLPAFDGEMADFSSRGPHDHANARFRTLKPDIAAPGLGVLAATTPTGNPDDGIGMANPSGYTSASGTSMASPHVAGAMLLIRQHLRNLGYDTTNLLDPQYREKRFEAQALARALAVNTATNLRTGTGIPDGDGTASVASLNDMGGGLIDISAAISADAVLYGFETLHDDTPDEYTAGGGVGPGDLLVPLPSHSFGAVASVGVAGIVESTHELTLRDITGQGHGTYSLGFQDNRNASPPMVEIDFSNGVGNPINQIDVLENGEATFTVHLRVQGDLLPGDPTEIMFFVTATHQGTDQQLRSPMIYRAVAPTIGEVAAPAAEDLSPLDPSRQPACQLTVDDTVTFDWSYAPPQGGATPTGFRVQLGSFSEVVFADDASEALVGGANSRWSGSAQWSSSVNPDTSEPAYFVPDAAMQNESLAMIDGAAMPAGGGTLKFLTRQDTEAGFDFAHVEVSTDGGAFSTINSSSGLFSGTRTLSVAGFTGGDVRVQLRMTSDDLVPAPGWWVQDIELTSDDFAVLTDTASGTSSIEHDVSEPGRYIFRVAGLFATDLGDAVGPYSASLCAETPLFLDGFETGDTSRWSRTSP